MAKKVSERALIERIQRKLKGEGERLHVNRDGNGLGGVETSRYYVSNEQNAITSWHDDLADLARQVGVLKPGEELDDER